MKNQYLFSFALLSILFAYSCKKKTMIIGPGSAPGGEYFSVGPDKKPYLNSKSIVIKKIDMNGNVIASKKVSEILYTQHYGNVFQIVSNSAEIPQFYNEGENVFFFEYSPQMIDTIKINVVLIKDKDKDAIGIDYLNVSCNNQPIIPLKSSTPGDSSWIFLL
ncbi:MAG: hypothetical protein WBP45_00600 [Daejeonella sp.]